MGVAGAAAAAKRRWRDGRGGWHWDWHDTGMR
jgi:hypothetical protein